MFFVFGNQIIGFANIGNLITNQYKILYLYVSIRLTIYFNAFLWYMR